MTHEVKLPPLGEDAPEQAEVSFWYVDEGEAVEEGQDLVEMVTDKAAFTIPAEVSGIVKTIRVKEGEKVQVGDVIAILESQR